MREDRDRLSFQFGNVGSSSRNNLVLFFSRVLNRVCFLVLGFVHDDLRFLLLGANSLRVPFVVTTLCLLPKMELGIGAVLNRPWSPVTMPVFSYSKP